MLKHAAMIHYATLNFMYVQSHNMAWEKLIIIRKKNPTNFQMTKKSRFSIVQK